ncbi:hypothetical protein VHEMI08299 [[Torrubiella] hemipterigena]|uniref:Uncharacterized protein n=1 Tax=[Torrubiella] hemipterigena TaxID=1531966 RepID=A0A0A1TNA7_9HYPO|nr:hypothetical protein VHEMI08299 [[Torrubiella] hemipterigena]
MLSTTVLTLAAAALAPMAAAAPEKRAALRNCSFGYNYCGSTLREIGRYEDQIVQALVDAHQDTNSFNRANALFKCKGGDTGVIEFITLCGNTCQTNGVAVNDQCR